MSTIVLTSVSGAPGVTTTAIGLGRVWPQSSLVVEDDTHHAMLAGYLRASQHAEPNLAAVANLTSTPTNAQTVWESIARPLPTDDPVGGLRRKGILGPPTPWSRAGIDTIIDLGRLATPLTSTPHLIAAPIVEDADMILVMIEATLRDIAGARTMVEGLAEQMNLAGAYRRLGLLVHRGGEARGVAEFNDKEITSALRLPVIGAITHDPAGAAQLSDGVGQRFDKSRLAHSLSKVAASLVDAINKRHADDEEDL